MSQNVSVSGYQSSWLVSLIRKRRWPYVVEGLFRSVFFFLVGLPWFGAVFPVRWLFEVTTCVVKVTVLFRSCVSSCRPRFCQQCKDEFLVPVQFSVLMWGRVTIAHIFFLVRLDRSASGWSVWFSKRCSPGTEELFLPQCVCGRPFGSAWWDYLHAVTRGHYRWACSTDNSDPVNSGVSRMYWGIKVLFCFEEAVSCRKWMAHCRN